MYALEFLTIIDETAVPCPLSSLTESFSPDVDKFNFESKILLSNIGFDKSIPESKTATITELFLFISVLIPFSTLLEILPNLVILLVSIKESISTELILLSSKKFLYAFSVSSSVS